MTLRAAGGSLLLDANALKAMELYCEVASLHLVRMTPNDSELPSAIDWFTNCMNNELLLH